MKPGGKGRWALALGALLGLAAAAWLLLRVDLGETLAVLGRFDATELTLLAALAGANLTARTARWRLCFEPAMRPAPRAAFHALALGTAANAFLPARGGDVLRAGLIARAAPEPPLGLAFATLAVEKVLDGLALAALAGTVALALDPPVWLVRLTLACAAGFGLGLVALVWIGRRKAATGVEPTSSAAGLGSRLRSGLAHFARGARGAMRNPAQLAALGALTALVWLTDLASVWAVGRSLGLEAGWIGAACLTAVVGLGSMIPAAPASLGSYELLCIAALGLVGIGSAPALAFGLALHAWTIAATALAALAALAARQRRGPGQE